MPSPVTLPPRFLLPSWSSRQLSQLQKLCRVNSRSRERPALPSAVQTRSLSDPPTLQKAPSWGIGKEQRAAKGRGDGQSSSNTTHEMPDLSKHAGNKPAYEQPEAYSETERRSQKRISTTDKRNNSGRGQYEAYGSSQRSYKVVGLVPRLQQNGSASLASDQVPSFLGEEVLKPISKNNHVDKDISSSLFDELFPGDKHGSTPPLTPSLFEELFPTESERHKKHNSQSQNERIGELDLPEIVHHRATGRHSRPQSARNTQLSPMYRQAWERDRLTMMVISGLSPTLEEADFHRLIPRGQHIEDWHAPGDVLRVMPGRRRTTLEARPLYYLAFSSPTLARAYKAHLQHLHALVRAYTPTSLLSPPLPEPGYYVRGEHVWQIVQDFALCGPSQDLRINILLPPYSPQIQSMLAEQGYSGLQNTSAFPKSGRSALVWVPGYPTNTAGIKAMLKRDGDQRGLPWGALQPHVGDLVAVQSNREAARMMRASGSGSSKLSSGRESGGVKEQDGEVVAEEEDDAYPFTDREALDPGPAGERSSPVQDIAAPGRRWLLTFADEAEARRFVRVWHRRPYPFAPHAHVNSHGLPGDPPPLVHAEFVW